jgi:NAD+ kinase
MGHLAADRPTIADPPAQVGVVVHPRRNVDVALAATRGWASRHGIAVGQVPIPGQTRPVAEPVDVAACDLVLALGGDGTALAALHVAALASRPVLGVACGSIGVLTSVSADRLPSALERVAAGDWTPRRLPGLDIAARSHDERVAINDFVAIRDGTGQVITELTVDDELYARTAGDGVVIATPLGSSAYTMAAGGPILMPGTEGMVVTSLAHHGGVSPPLVVAPDSRIGLSVEPGYGGGRFEVDGQALAVPAREVTISLRRGYATLVTLADEEPLLTGLRRRGLLVDAPRILARDARRVRRPGEDARPGP